MNYNEFTTGIKTFIMSLLILSLLITGCGQTSEEEYAVITLETEESQNDLDIYWSWAEDWLSDMLLENESIERRYIKESYELFSDEWYEHGSRLTEPYLYVFSCAWRDTNKTSPDDFPEQDDTFYSVEFPRRSGDYKGYFIFSIWVKKTDHGIELGTDFHQKMLQYILYECSKEHYEENAYLIGLSPSEQGMMWCPLFDILGDPVVLVSVTEKEKLEPVFRDACERMHERQKQISGELGQTVRFGAVFDDYPLSWWDEEIIEYDDFEDKHRYDDYITYMNEQRIIGGYRRWLERYGRYYPTFRLDFHTGYDAEKQNIFQEMCVYRELYLDAQHEKEEPVQEAQPAEPEFWTVNKGDSLWKIARQQYGDGRLWKQIYERNHEMIGADENVLSPGQVLELP